MAYACSLCSDIVMYRLVIHAETDHLHRQTLCYAIETDTKQRAKPKDIKRDITCDALGVLIQHKQTNILSYFLLSYHVHAEQQ